MDYKLGKFTIREVTQKEDRSRTGWKLYFQPSMTDCLTPLSRHLVLWFETKLPTMHRVMSIKDMLRLILKEVEVYCMCHNNGAGVPISISERPKLVFQRKDRIRIDFQSTSNRTKTFACLYSPSPVGRITDTDKGMVVKKLKGKIIDEKPDLGRSSIDLTRLEIHRYFNSDNIEAIIPE